MVKEDIEMGAGKTLDFIKPIYVLLYHPWVDGFEEYFAVHLSWLKRNEFESIPLEGLMQYLKGEEVRIPERPIAITLDDGTIEDYTIAYPLLKKYGFIGTVFAPTADKYIKFSRKDWWKEVEREGVLRIEGHSHTHALTFINDCVDDFYVERKETREPIIKGLDLKSGAPIFGMGYELISRRFIPHQEFIDICLNYVRKQGDGFLKKEHWKAELMDLVSKHNADRGRFETEEEKGRRIKEELELSRTIIEEAVDNGKKVHFFAYPFGAYDSYLMEYMKHAGYTGAFTTNPGGNVKGDNPYLLKRMMILNQDSFGGLGSILAEYL